VAEYNRQARSILQSEEKQDFDLVFIGKMDYRPNVDAVIWFADAVWPKIVAKQKGITLAIVGQKPHTRLDRLHEVPGITVTGWVDKVQPYLDGSRVFIMPFRVGSGTRLKLIEALAAGKAVISTTLGVEGYPVKDEQELMLADSASEMADKTVRLLKDKALRNQLGKAGREFARQYDWRKVIPLFDEVYDTIT
jgi:glycosyltransferase involved in cell wall biosynthesis